MPRKSNTRGAQGGGTIRQRKDGRWEARYTVGRDPGTGKQVQRSVYGATQQEVRKKLAQAVAALDSGDYFEPSKMTLARWVEIWLQEYTGDKKYLTVKHYKAQCKTHIVPSLGAVKLAELTTPQIQAFYNRLLRDGMAPKKCPQYPRYSHKMPLHRRQRGIHPGQSGQPCHAPPCGEKRNSPAHG